MKLRLPHCDTLFTKYFDRWYDDESRGRKLFKATRPDLLEDESLIGREPAEFCVLTDESRQEVADQLQSMLEAARRDWPDYLDVTGDVDLDWVDQFDGHFDRTRIREVLKRSDPENFANDYVVLCCECGAVLGEVMRRLQPRLVWHLDWPYWESALFDANSGSVIPVFHWAVKKMSGYGVDDGLADKVRSCVESLDQPED
jgi:hypothetical protein